ncbi:MAG: hypothetical protein ACHQ53_12675 [Polyangiales bacterium]
MPVFLPQGYGTALLSAAAFWLLLALPGYALVRRLWPAALGGGPLSALALGYLFSFALLTPVAVVGYAFRLPILVLSCALVVGVAAACRSLFRDRKAFVLRRPSFIGAVSIVIIVADAVLGLRSGSNFGGDGRHHAARTRMLLVHGFNSLDPLVSGGRYDDVYHSNLYHALLASSAQLIHVQAPAAWAFSLFFAKLACCAAVYHCAWSILAERWVAWCASALFALYMAPLSTDSYPNTLGVYFFLLLGVALLVQVVRAELDAWPLWGLAALALVLPQFHALYYVFACLLFAPVLLLARLAKGVGGIVRASSRQLAIALLVLALGSPWLGATFWYRAHQPRARPSAAAPGLVHAPLPSDTRSLPAYARARARQDRGFVQLGGGWTMLDPGSALDPQGAEMQLLGILALGLLFSRRRRELAVVAAVALLTALLLYAPPLCTALIKVAGAPWIVRRLSAMSSALHIGLAPAMLFSLAAQIWPKPWLHAGCFGLSLAYAYTFGVDSGAWTRATYLERGVSGKWQYNGLRGHARRRALFTRAVPFGAPIAVAPQRSGELVVDCDCYPLALGLDQSTHGVSDMEQRRADTDWLLGGGGHLRDRVALLRHYGVRVLYVRGDREHRGVKRAYRRLIVKTDEYRKDRVVTLDLSRASSDTSTPVSESVPDLNR